MSALGEQYAGRAQRERTLIFGLWVFLLTEVLLFSALFALYAAYRAMYGEDFVQAIRHNTWGYGTVNMYLLLTSSFTVALAGATRARPRMSALLLGATVFLGAGFLVVKGFEYAEHIREGALPGPYFHLAALPTPGANRFYSMYWLMTGVHALHVAVGMLVIAWLTMRTLRGAYTVEEHVGLEMGSLYWHLVDAIWIVLWPLMYLA